MLKFLARSLCAIALIATVPAVRADVLTFDDLPSGPAFFIANYHGFQFGTNDPQTTAWFHTDEASPFYVPHSGSTYIATDFTLYQVDPFTTTQPISSTTAFVFDGAWFSGGEQVHYELYSGGSLVFTSADSAVLTDVPIFVASGYAGLVDSVVIYGHQGFYVLDDFTYNARATDVPEPSGIALLGIGALACVLARRRRTIA